MTCLICRYFRPIEPSEHKQQREAGQCQSACGNKWNQHTAIEYVKNHGPLDGWCLLHPESKRFPYNHVCGDISVVGYFLNHDWGVKPFDRDHNLMEWATDALQIVLYGSWYTRRARELTKQNEKMQQQLKRVRKISASRLARLQKDKDKQERSQEPEIAPVYPHLVAAE